MKLWEKTYEQQKTAEEYCFGDTAMLDTALVIHDVIGSLAHAQMLVSIGILSHLEYQKLKKVFCQIISLTKINKFKIETGDEDVHTKIENYLTQKLGELGKKIHTGRSRNDQIQVDLHLYTKEKLLQITTNTLKLADVLYEFAQKYEFIPMPGYTHMQKAMPSSIGMWAGSFAESILDDMEIVKTAYVINDQSPLGSGAAYGVSLPINRELTAKLLGFSKVQNNSLYAQVSRGKSHLITMHALSQIMLTLARFAEDLLLFTTGEFNFFSVNETLTTGSSIMPQKKNLDILELVRAKTQTVLGYEHIVASIISSLPSGYNADFGETKSPFMKSMEIVNSTLPICKLMVKSTKPNTKILLKSCSSELFATHAAYQQVKKGISFREAYKQIGLSLDKLPRYDVEEVIKASNHTGGPGKLGLMKVKTKIQKELYWWLVKQNQFKKTILNLGITDYTF